MTAWLSLWLPILVAAIAVFVASSLIHMVFKWHNSDYRALPDEEAVRGVLRAAKLSPGLYVTPYCADMNEMANETMQQKYREGPVAFVTIFRNGMPNMGKLLSQWFLLNLLVAAAAALIAAQSMPLAGNAHQGAHLIGLVSFLAYGVGSLCDTIWMGRTWSATLKDLLDALIYGTVSALSFLWLWPAG